MSDETKHPISPPRADEAKVATAPAAQLGRAMSALASGLVPPEGRPMSALELSELRALMATGTWRPAQQADVPPAGQPAFAGSGDSVPLSATEIAAIKTQMLVRPYVPHPMPGTATSKGDDETPDGDA